VDNVNNPYLTSGKQPITHCKLEPSSLLLLPFLALTETPGGMDFLVAKGMLNEKGVTGFMALTGKTARKPTGAARSGSVAPSGSKDILNYSCGNKSIKLYATSKAAFIDKDKS